MTYIHESAYIDEGASLGSDCKVWHFCHIMKDTNIGHNCILGQNVFIAPGVTIGNYVKIQNNVSVYTGVVVEDDVFLGPSMVFTNVINPRSFIERKEEFLPTIVRRGASIGANATVVCGNTIGQYALIGAGTVIIKNVPDYALMVGNPGRQVGWVSKAGIKLEFDYDGNASCNVSGESYRLEGNRVYLVNGN